MSRKNKSACWRIGRGCVFLVVMAYGAIALAQSSASPASGPATAPMALLTLHATAANSGEVDLYWYDVNQEASRYLIERSDDGLKSWHIVGNLPTGSATARYDTKDVNKITPNTGYFYRLNSAAPGRPAITEAVEVLVPRKNLLEVIDGTSSLTMADAEDVGFWVASSWAATKLLASFIPHLLMAALIFALFYVVHHFTRRVVSGSMAKANIDIGVHDLLLTILKWTILGFAIVMACDQIGFHITALLTGLSIGALAVGFAAQDTLANFIASIVIFWDKPFKVGDWVTVDDQYGKVIRVTFRSTRILTPAGDIIVVPNVQVMGNKLMNHSANPINWVNVPIGIPSSLAIERARAALLATCTGDSRIMTDPPPRVVVDSVNPDSVKLFLSFCIKDEAIQAMAMQDYLEKSKNALDQIKG